MLMFVPILFVFACFFCFGVYVVCCRNRQMAGRIAIAAAMGMLLQTLQYLTVFDRFSMSWPPPFSGILAAMRVLAFDTSSLGAACVFGNSPFVASLLRVGFPFLGMSSIALTSRIADKLMPERFPFNADAVVCAIGILWNSFFISLCVACK